VERDGQHWISYPRRDWLDIVGLGSDEFDSALGHLNAYGLVQSDVDRFPLDRRNQVVHLCFPAEALEECLIDYDPVSQVVTALADPDSNVVTASPCPKKDRK